MIDILFTQKMNPIFKTEGFFKVFLLVCTLLFFVSYPASEQDDNPWAAALWSEYYCDNEGVIVSIENSPYGFRTSELSSNVNFASIPQIACRLEGRWLYGADEIYSNDNIPTKSDSFIVGSIAVILDKDL